MVNSQGTFCRKKDGLGGIGWVLEVRRVIAAVWVMLSGLLYSLQLSTGSFPKPLSAKEEAKYLALAAQGDREARDLLIERNLRLVAHIMKKY